MTEAAGVPPAIMAALKWVQASFIQPDPAEAWRMTDPDMRLARVQSWCWSTGQTSSEWRSQAVELAETGTSHPSWPEFHSWNWNLRQEMFGSFFAAPFGTYSEVDLLELDLEGVTFIAGDATDVGPESEVVAQVVIMRFDGSWRVAGLGSSIAIPGWPPSERRVRRRGSVS